MDKITRNIEQYLGTAVQLLSAANMPEAVEVLKACEPSVEEDGYDNWNGGTTIWSIVLRISPQKYALLSEHREIVEEQITRHLKPVIEHETDDWWGVKILPKVIPQPEWRDTDDGVPREIRQNIIDGLKIDNVFWWGRLDEVEFLQRIFDLNALPSTDSRFETAAADIWQHRENNPEDWPNDWVYTDHRFKLLDGPTDGFLRFLSEVVHPVVRPDKEESAQLVEQFNDQLRRAGWFLAEEEKIAGRTRFVPRRIDSSQQRSFSRARTVADSLDAAWMQKEIERLEDAVELDPALAIGTAKDLVETCCKTLLSKRGVSYSKSTDLPKLTKLLAAELRLVPDDIPDEAKGVETVRLILRNLSALTQYLAELRGLYGSGHGRDGKHRGLEPRHARLAVGAAVAFIDFVTATHEHRGSSNPTDKSPRLPAKG